MSIVCKYRNLYRPGVSKHWMVEESPLSSLLTEIVGVKQFCIWVQKTDIKATPCDFDGDITSVLGITLHIPTITSHRTVDFCFKSMFGKP